MVKEGINKMNKTAMLKLQLIRYLRGISLFLVVYLVSIGLFSFIAPLTKLSFDFDNLSYIFVIYLGIISWIITGSSVKLFSYHSYSRQSIINMSSVVQLIISLLASLLLMGHTFLMGLFPTLSKDQAASQVRNIYISDLTTIPWLQVLLTIVFIMLAIFTLLQLTNLVLISTYKMKRRNAIILILVMALIVFGILFSLPFWSKSMIGVAIMVFGFLFGTGQSMVPAIVIPLVILCLITLVSYLLSKKWLKQLEIYKNISI